MNCNYELLKSVLEEKELIGGKMYFKAAWNINRMRGRVMADQPFMLVLQVVPRHPATAALLLRYSDTQMPVLHSTWKHTCCSASSLVWQPNLFVNQGKSCFLSLKTSTLSCSVAWLGVRCFAFCHKSLFTPYCVSKLSWKCFLFRVGLWNRWLPAAKGFLCQRGQRFGSLSAPEDCV